MTEIKLKSLKFTQVIQNNFFINYYGFIEFFIILFIFVFKTEGLNRIFPVEPNLKDDDADESEDQSSSKSEEAELKDNWSNQSDYLFQAISYCVGLGAFWRFV